MSTSFLIWLTIVGFLSYVLYRDPNVTAYILLQNQNFSAKLGRLKYFITNNPNFFWVRWRISRNTDRAARNLGRDLGVDKNKDWHD